MGTLGRTWQLFKQSFAVLAADKEILLFPILSTSAAILAFAGFFVPLYTTGMLELIARGQGAWTDYIPLFSWYYVNYFIVIFFNSALVGCANIRLSGGDPTLGDGFRIAAARVHRIAAWTLLAATVGLLLHALESRSRRAGKIAASVLGLGWTLITYLVIPVLIFEDLGVFASVRRSAELFRGRWGEQIVGQAGFGLLSLVLALPGLALGFLLWSYDRAAAIILVLIYILILAAVVSATKGIFTVALYRYAAGGAAPFGFSEELMRSTFQPRVERRW